MSESAAPKRVGIVAGSSLLSSDVFSSALELRVRTEFGAVRMHVLESAACTLYMCQRHHASFEADYDLPHKINYPAIAAAFREQGVTMIFGFCSVGALNTSYHLGDFIIPDDFFAPFDVRHVAVDYSAHHVPELAEPLRSKLAVVTEKAGYHVKLGGTYTNSRGPRFETKAEIKFFQQHGEIIGMTAAHEATCIAEVNIPYAILCIVDNFANGLAAEELTLDGFKAAQRQSKEAVQNVFKSLVEDVTGGASFSAGSPAASPRRMVKMMVHARYVVPVEPEGVVLDHHTVVVNAKGDIEAVLPTDEAKRTYRSGEELYLDDHAVFPGFVNCHTHVPMNHLRGCADDLPLLEWLTTNIWPIESRLLSPEYCRAGSEQAIAEMLHGGTTCFNDMYFFPDDIAQVVEASGIRAIVGCPVMEFPTAWASNADEYLLKADEVWKKWQHRCDRVGVSIAPHAPYTVGDKTFEKVRDFAKERDMRVHIHLHETTPECEDSANGTPSMSRHQSEKLCRPFKNLSELGLIHDRLIAVHMTNLTEPEIEELVTTGASVVHCPASNLKLASGFAPVAKLIDAGVNVALGTDSTASNNSLDMFAELKLAALLAKGVAGNPAVVSAAKALSMATLYGARAMGLDERIGSLVPGKAADMVAVRLGGVDTTPLYSVVSHIVYSLSKHNVSDVWVQGKRLLRSGELVTINREQLLKDAVVWQEKVILALAEHQASVKTDV